MKKFAIVLGVVVAALGAAYAVLCLLFYDDIDDLSGSYYDQD